MLSRSVFLSDALRRPEENDEPVADRGGGSAGG